MFNSSHNIQQTLVDSYIKMNDHVIATSKSGVLPICLWDHERNKSQNIVKLEIKAFLDYHNISHNNSEGTKVA